MAKTAPQFRCAECGWQSFKWVGRCGECQAWGSVEEIGGTPAVSAAKLSGAVLAKPITEVSTKDKSHSPTGSSEVDRVLGGGLVAGATILLSGEPGVGKSTLLLDLAARLGLQGKRALYISAEESESQIRLRAERIGAMNTNLFLSAEQDLSRILGQIEALKPDLVVVDSVQTVSADDVSGSAGMPAQVRLVASNLIRTAKQLEVPLLLVGHVTKDGSIAGPRVLEHLVDVVCQFEGDRQTALRFIRTLKNRFGPTDEVGCFEMTGEGIVEVADPSALFLSGNPNPVAGSCVTVTVDGRRSMLVEIQALVVRSSSPQPRRVVSGVDSSRVAMILAVLERRAGVKLSESDVYVSTVGGFRIFEPAADLAIAIALASAAGDVAVIQNTAAYGEISLAGEIRGVTLGKQRAAEANRMGRSNLVSSERGVLAKALAAALPLS
jgi:DNA repair protein RadA/Sms